MVEVARAHAEASMRSCGRTVEVLRRATVFLQVVICHWQVQLVVAGRFRQDVAC